MSKNGRKSHLEQIQRCRPAPAAVEDLIRRAERHPLGTQFLCDGAQESVAALFSVHAFVVDEARNRLRGA